MSASAKWKPPTNPSKNQRRKMARENRICALTDNRCIYCDELVPANKRSIEHLWPKSLGGTRCVQNILMACKRCNSRRGDRWPASKYAHPRWQALVRKMEAAQGYVHKEDDRRCWYCGSAEHEDAPCPVRVYDVDRFVATGRDMYRLPEGGDQ